MTTPGKRVERWRKMLRAIAFVPVMVAVVAVVTPGCGLPLPARHKVLQGAKFTSSNTHWMEPGKTTRADVESRLGPPSIGFTEENVVLYRWETRVGIKLGGGDITRSDALLIQFSPDRTVRKFEIRKIPKGEFAPKDIRDWAAPSIRPN
jgi:outer membrane protein assembly factor BamE (lipoprotein component of BamABCDE complex)